MGIPDDIIDTKWTLIMTASLIVIFILFAIVL